MIDLWTVPIKILRCPDKLPAYTGVKFYFASVQKG